VQNRQGLLALRLLLAMLETGSYPSILTQLSSWYPSDEMATPVVWLLGISQCPSIVGSLLCYGISYMGAAMVFTHPDYQLRLHKTSSQPAAQNPTGCNGYHWSRDGSLIFPTSCGFQANPVNVCISLGLQQRH
jgi:hypothetical protein